jgi:preprotein translocase subunit YajC
VEVAGSNPVAPTIALLAPSGGQRNERDQSSTESLKHPMSSQPMLMIMQASPIGGTGGTAGLVMGIAPWLLIFVIFYLLMIRPQQQRVKQHQAAIAAVKKGDEVITGGGIRGRVTKVSDEEAEVEIAQGVKIRVVKSTISQVLTVDAKPAND